MPGPPGSRSLPLPLLASSSTRFADLGIPFPLFEADIEHAAPYHGLGRRSLCDQPDRHVFSLNDEGPLVVRRPVYAIDREVGVRAGSFSAGLLLVAELSAPAVELVGDAAVGADGAEVGAQGLLAPDLSEAARLVAN